MKPPHRSTSGWKTHVRMRVTRLPPALNSASTTRIAMMTIGKTSEPPPVSKLVEPAGRSDTSIPCEASSAS